MEEASKLKDAEGEDDAAGAGADGVGGGGGEDDAELDEKAQKKAEKVGSISQVYMRILVCCVLCPILSVGLVVCCRASPNK